jgi:hypothetical protein
MACPASARISRHLGEGRQLIAIQPGRYRVCLQRDWFWAFPNTNVPPVRNIRTLKVLKLIELALRGSKKTIFDDCIFTEHLPTRFECAFLGPRITNAMIHVSRRALEGRVPAVQSVRPNHPAALSFQQIAAANCSPLLGSVVEIGFVQPSWFV